jgi:hypothetical protein
LGVSAPAGLSHAGHERRGALLDAQFQITGLVASPAVLGAATLAELPQDQLEEGIDCEDSAVRQPAWWGGVRLADVVALGQPLPEARYVRVCAGEYAVPLSLEEARTVLLATTLNGQPLTHERGAPFRLIVPGGTCFTSVKWIDRLVVTAESGPNDGERLARAQDSAAVSVLSLASVQTLSAQIGRPLDPRQFRPNIVIETTAPGLDSDDDWLDRLLVFGDPAAGARLRINRRDKRCMMVNLDPETANQDPALLRAIVQRRDQCTGLYATPERVGIVRVGDVVALQRM